MKLLYLKWTRICCRCNQAIVKGIPTIRTYSRLGKFYRRRHYHKECLYYSLDEWFRSNEPVAKKGNKKSIYSKKRRAILSLLIYHRKLGHSCRVEELQREIALLEEMKVQVADGATEVVDTGAGITV